MGSVEFVGNVVGGRFPFSGRTRCENYFIHFGEVCSAGEEVGDAKLFGADSIDWR